MYKYLLPIALFLCSFSSFSQVEIGSWRDYLPYSQFNIIEDAGDRVYAATPYSVMEISKSDNAITLLSKIEGLTETGVTAMAYHESTNTLMVGYETGNMDFIVGNKIINVADILRANVIGDKIINNFSIYENEVFISCGFGIVLYDLSEMEVRDTYIIGDEGDYDPVNDVVVFNDTVYATLEYGLKYADINNQNLAYHGNWFTNTTIPNNSSNFSFLEANDDRMFVCLPVNDSIADTIYQYIPDNGWNEVTELSDQNINSIHFNDSEILVSRDGYATLFDENWNQLRLETGYGDNRIANPNDAVLSSNGTMWIADNVYGVIESPETFIYNLYSPDAPHTSNVEDIKFAGEKVLVATGGKTSTWSNSYVIDGVFERDATGNWGEYSLRFISELNPVRDYIRVVVDPNDNNHFFCSTLGAGLLEFSDGEYVQTFDTTNSSLTVANGTSYFVGTTGLTYDSEDNLWVANTLSNMGLHVYTVDNEWYRYNLSEYISGNVCGDIVVDESDQVWMTLPNSGLGVLVLNHNNTLSDNSDDQITIINTSNNLPSGNIYSIAKDLNGEIWIGTDEGIGVIYSPSSVFTNGVSAQLPLIERDGYLQYLLSSSTVTSIAVDGANRKWCGTSSSGVYLISEDGTEELLHFTKDNSPLLSNNIKSIGVNPNDGEVLIGTDEGIIGYKGTATEPDPYYSNVYAYPNPVRPDYSGLVAIKGLAENSHVKISDINGQMVFETYSEGGQAIWDGNLRGGGRASSGVYLVFAADEDGIEREVTKILFLH